MILRTGNLWDAPADVGATVIAVTTNSTVTRDGRLVMGRGAALGAKPPKTPTQSELQKLVAWEESARQFMGGASDDSER